MNQVSIRIPDGRAAKKLLQKAAGIAILLYIAYLVREIWLPLGLAFLLAMILDPVVDRMERRGWSRTLASTFIFGSFLIILAGLLVLAFPSIAAQIDSLQRGYERYFPDPSHEGLAKSFHRMGLSPGLTNAAVSAIEGARGSLNRSSGWVTDYGMPILSNAIWIVIVPIVAFYTLRDFHLILAKGLLLVPARRRDLVQIAVTEITGIFGKYLRGLGIVSVLNGIATGILLAILGVPGSLLLGVVAGVLYSVPYLGALLTLMLTGAVAFLGGGLHLLVLSVGLSILLHQVVFDQIISPRILGAHVGLHPILSIVALLVGNLLLGIPGMVLAVPVAACIQIAVLAVVPKLSQEIEIPTGSPGQPDTVESLAAETMEQHEKVDATEEMHSAITSALESLEKAESGDQE